MKGWNPDPRDVAEASRGLPEYTARPAADRNLRILEILIPLAAVVDAVLLFGLRSTRTDSEISVSWLSTVAVGVLIAVGAVRYHWSLRRLTWLREHRARLVLLTLWLAGTGLIAVELGWLLRLLSADGSPMTSLFRWSEIIVAMTALVEVVKGGRRAAAGSASPAVLLVASFLILTGIGTLILMLPAARAENVGGAPFSVALFTATSASCVTGLMVVPTGSYWSTTGHCVILGLFQIGGLGIMTWGAFFALVSGQQLQFRESATMRQLLESEGLGDGRRLLVAILIFTLLCEAAGAVAISGLWSDRTPGERIFASIFHSVSGFCNAGFSLMDNGFKGMGHRWQVWGGLCTLIIVGGLGFSVLYNIVIVLRSRLRMTGRAPLFDIAAHGARLTVTSRLVLISVACLLLGGTVLIYVLEQAAAGSEAVVQGPADAWFQSVTFRTAGFATVDPGELQPATRLLAIALMFIGASPGSTGGGVKTICFVLALLAVLSVLRGRSRVEIFGRHIPQPLLNRAMAIMAIGLLVVLLCTGLLVLFERQPERFLDHLFESTSAFATVGVSTGITPDLTPPSRLVIIVTMFVGRVGPLTLLMALAGRTTDARYDYPAERVLLG